MNKYVNIESLNKIINLENVYYVGKHENKEQKMILIIYEDSNHFELDYSDIKDDINEEKTTIQKDYEKIQNILFEKENKEIEDLKSKIKNLEFLISCLKINSNKYSEIKYIINSKQISKLNKINKIVKE